MIDLLQRAVRPVADQRQIDLARRLRHLSGHDGDIAFRDAAFGEGGGQRPLRLDPASERHHARGRHVEPVDGERVGICGLKARDQAVLLVRAAPRHAEQPRRLDRDQQVRVGVQDHNALPMRTIGRSSPPGSAAAVSSIGA